MKSTLAQCRIVWLRGFGAWPSDQAVAEKDRTAARVLIAGIRYKKNVDDMRESPCHLKLIELLETRG